MDEKKIIRHVSNGTHVPNTFAVPFQPLTIDVCYPRFLEMGQSMQQKYMQRKSKTKEELSSKLTLTFNQDHLKSLSEVFPNLRSCLYLTELFMKSPYLSLSKSRVLVYRHNMGYSLDTEVHALAPQNNFNFHDRLLIWMVISQFVHKKIAMETNACWKPSLDFIYPLKDPHNPQNLKEIREHLKTLPIRSLFSQVQQVTDAQQKPAVVVRASFFVVFESSVRQLAQTNPICCQYEVPMDHVVSFLKQQSGESNTEELDNTLVQTCRRSLIYLHDIFCLEESTKMEIAQIILDNLRSSSKPLSCSPSSPSRETPPSPSSSTSPTDCKETVESDKKSS